MMNRKELNAAEMNMIIGGADYNVKWDENSKSYFIFNKSGKRVFEQEKLLTKHGLVEFMENHPEDNFTIL